MKFFSRIVFVALLLCSVVPSAFSQKKVKLGLTNAVVIGQMDNQEDRYSIEINLTEMFSSRGIKAVPSLNLIKLGSDSQQLSSDSIAAVLKSKGIDTYVLVSVRGYDRTFKLSTSSESLDTALARGNLYGLYQPDIVSVSFEFKFYRAEQLVKSEIVKLGNIGGRDAVIKRFRSKVGKLIDKKWKK